MSRLTYTIATLVFVGGAGCIASEEPSSNHATAQLAGGDQKLGAPCTRGVSRYFLEPTACVGSALACYSGQVVGAGMGSGDMTIEIKERGADPVLGELGSYYGESKITNKHGSIEYHHVGFLVAHPVKGLPWVLQSDISWVTGGEGKPASAIAYNHGQGTAIIALDGSLSSLSGTLYSYTHGCDDE